MIFNILGAKVKAKYKDDPDGDGESKLVDNKILIPSDLKGELHNVTLVHEFMHFVLYRSGLDQGLSDVVIEAICDSAGFAFSENKNLWIALQNNKL